VKKEFVFSSAMIAVGLLDWLTTVAGILFFGATEANPILTGLTTSSLLLFSMIKLVAVVIVGLTFSKAVSISESITCGWNFTKSFLYGGYSLTLLILLAIINNNIFVFFRS
jgi:hypothetical protein